MTKAAKRSLALNTLSHAAVDLCCLFVLYRSLFAHADFAMFASVGFLAYNIIAFGFQIFIGYLCDRAAIRSGALLGSVLVLAAVALTAAFAFVGNWLSWLCMACAALGNACFHIGGGIDTLSRSSGRMAPSGVFVASGALGVTLGILLGRNSSAVAFWFACLIAICATVMCSIARCLPTPDESDHAAAIAPSTLPSARALTVIILAWLVVVVRSLAGGITPLDWSHTTLPLLLVPALCAAGGKMLGGFFADALGARRISLISLALSAICFAAGGLSVWFTLTGIIFFNITMPVTLCVIAARFPRYPGFAFGLTTLGLLVGALPCWLVAIPGNVALPALIALTIISMVLLMFVTSNRLPERADIHT